MTNGPIPQNRVREAYQQLVAGEIDRRQFMAQAGALGLGAGAVAMIVQNVALAQDASPVASPAATPVAAGFVRPDAGTDGQTRGEGGELRILVP